MSIDELYEQVTDAILRAEALEKQGPSIEASRAYLDVSMLEEQIAQQLPPVHPEGAIARRGAVRAAVTAGLVRARKLAEQYGAESGAPPELVHELEQIASPPGTLTAQASVTDQATSSRHRRAEPPRTFPRFSTPVRRMELQ